MERGTLQKKVDELEQVKKKLAEQMEHLQVWGWGWGWGGGGVQVCVCKCVCVHTHAHTLSCVCVCVCACMLLCQWTGFWCIQSRASSAEADRDKLLQAKEGWTEERLALKEQLQCMQDELSKLKVLFETCCYSMCNASTVLWVGSHALLNWSMDTVYTVLLPSLRIMYRAVTCSPVSPSK